MQIRAATNRDFNAWQTVRRKLWADVGEAESHDFLSRVLSNPTTQQIFLAIADDGETVGFIEAGLRRDYVEGCETSPVGYIEGWFVEAKYRRQAVGQKLVRAAEDWARKVGCREMGSDCELKNSVSLRAHLGVGYEEAGRNIHFRKIL